MKRKRLKKAVLAGSSNRDKYLKFKNNQVEKTLKIGFFCFTTINEVIL